MVPTASQDIYTFAIDRKDHHPIISCQKLDCIDYRMQDNIHHPFTLAAAAKLACYWQSWNRPMPLYLVPICLLPATQAESSLKPTLPCHMIILFDIFFPIRKYGMLQAIKYTHKSKVSI